MTHAHHLNAWETSNQIMLNSAFPGPEPHPPPCIMVVEDEVLIRANLAGELRELDFRVIEAANADEAWAILQAGTDPDLVFSDITMPGSFDGLELAARIQRHYPHIKIIITSGNLGTAQKPENLLFIAKPYRIAEAIDTAKKYLGLD